MSQNLMSQIARKAFSFSSAVRKGLGKPWAVSHFWDLNYCQLQYLPTACTISQNHSLGINHNPTANNRKDCCAQGEGLQMGHAAINSLLDSPAFC